MRKQRRRKTKKSMAKRITLISIYTLFIIGIGVISGFALNKTNVISGELPSSELSQESKAENSQDINSSFVESQVSATTSATSSQVSGTLTGSVVSSSTSSNSENQTSVSGASTNSVPPESSVFEPSEPEGTFKEIAVTFDDGPHSTNTRKVMDIAEEYGGHVTFFMLGQRIAGNEDLIADVDKRGHEIGNHSWSHAQLNAVSDETLCSELDKTQNAIFNITGKYPKQFRPPYGARNDLVNQRAADRGLGVVLWTVDTLDWKYRDAQYVCDTILECAEEGDVILLHDIHATSVEGFGMAMKQLDEDGFKLVTVSELYS